MNFCVSKANVDRASEYQDDLRPGLATYCHMVRQIHEGAAKRAPPTAIAANYSMTVRPSPVVRANGG